MPVPKKLPQTAAEATAGNYFLLTDFYKRTTAGRPKGSTVQKHTKRGPVPQLKPPPTVAPLNDNNQMKRPANTADSTSNKKVKVNRINWAKGKGKAKLDIAINDFLGKRGTALDDNGEMLPLQAFLKISGIPYSTLKKYVCANAEKCHLTGCHVGRAALLSLGDQHFTADILARMDCGNNGASVNKAVTMVQDVSGNKISQKSARNHLSQMLTKNFSHLLKKKPVVAQAMTTKQSAITVEQQFCWHQTFEAALNEMQQCNQGLCCLTNLTFGEVIQHFITGGDEMCFMASEDAQFKS